MTSEFRQVLFHVRRRLIQVREARPENENTSLSETMTMEQALVYLEQAINVELARPYTARKAVVSNAARAWRARKALRTYVEAKNEQLDNSTLQITELIADLLHLLASIDPEQSTVNHTLRRARLLFDQAQRKVLTDSKVPQESL